MKAGRDPLAPSFEKGGSLYLAGIVRHYTFAERGGIPAQWRDFGKRLDALDASGPAYGVVLDAGSDDGFDYMTAVEVDEDADLPPGFTTRDLEAGRFAVFHHPDNVASLSKTLDAVHRDHAPSFASWQVKGVWLIERYGEAFDPASGEGGVDVLLPLKS